MREKEVEKGEEKKIKVNKSTCVRRKDVLTRQLGSEGSKKNNKEDSVEVQESIARQGAEKRFV